MAQHAHKKAGRRKGAPSTRQAILRAAQAHFAATGYDGTTIRAVAAEAKVDPALVMHFFKNKQNLFIEATLPVHNPLEELRRIIEGDEHTLGQRLAAYMVDFLEDPQTGPATISLIQASLGELTNSPLQNQVEQQLLDTFASLAVSDQSRLRASFICAQYFGFVIARYINKMEPLASASRAEVITLLAPTLQRYLREKL